MKKTILLFALLMTFGHLYSQTNIYHPFPDSNAIWIGTEKTFDGIDCLIYDHYNMYIDGDTTIGQYTYHKLFKNGYKYSNCPPPGFYYFKQLYSFFRQDIPNKKIYINIQGADTLAYDFNLNVGEPLPPSYLNETYYFIVQSEDSVYVGNSYRKMYWLLVVDSNPPYYIRLIEGIGSDQGPLAPIMENWFEYSNEFYCIYEDNTLLWQYYSNGFGCDIITSTENQMEETIIDIQPNPFRKSAKIIIPDNYTNIELSLFNSYGQKIKEVMVTKESYNLHRDELPIGLYVIQFKSHGQLISTKKVIITD